MQPFSSYKKDDVNKNYVTFFKEMSKLPNSPRTPKYPKYSEVNSRTSTPRGVKSPRLQVPAYETPQTRKDAVNAIFVSFANQNLRYLPPGAKNKHVIALNLENNQFDTNSLKELPKNLTSLSLSNNPLLSCAIPKFDRLRSLILDNCQIDSFVGLPKFPNLRLFSIANNNISNLNGIQIFTKLESFNISNNAFDFDPVICIAAIGSISLTKFNGIQISSIILTEAFKFSPIVGYALRHGRDPNRQASPQEEIEVSQDFLNKDLYARLMEDGMDPSLAKFKYDTSGPNVQLILPFNATNIKWYRDVLPTETCPSEWAPVQGFINKDTPNILELTNIMKMHLLKCDFTINNQNFSLYTDEPVGRKPTDLVLPFPLDPILAGLPLEGSMISLIPLPIPTRVAWVSGSRVIKEDETAIIVSNEEIGKPVTCLLAPYCPNFPSVIFATLFTETEIVQPLLPTVSGITFPDVIIQDEEIEFTRVMTPEREGNSVVLIERSKMQSSSWEVAAQIDPTDFRFTPTRTDVGCYLRVSYTPETTEGTQGETVYFYSDKKVLPQFPRFDNPSISGITVVGHTLVAAGQYNGGHPGNHIFNWMIANDAKSATLKNIKNLEVVGNGRTLKVTPEMEGKVICLEMIPVRDDEVVGEKIFLVEEKPVEPAEVEELREITYSQPIYAGKKIQLEESVQFFVSSPDSPIGYEPVKFGNTFVPRAENIGQFIRVEAEGAEGLLGEVLEPAPLLKEVSIKADKCVEGQMANLAIKVQKMSVQNIEIIWSKVKGSTEKVVAVNSSTYVFTSKDVGFAIQARVYAYDQAGNIIGSLITEKTNIIQPQGNSVPVISGDFTEGGSLHIECEKEFSEVAWFKNSKGQWVQIGEGNEYTVTKDDVGSAIRCTMKIAGNTITVTSKEVVDSGLPTVVLDAPEQAIEGEALDIGVKYTGGKEGKSQCLWERLGAEGLETVVANNTNVYTITKDDVGCTIKLEYAPPSVRRGSAVAHAIKTMEQVDPNKMSWTIEKYSKNDTVVDVIGKELKEFEVGKDDAGCKIKVIATSTSRLRSPSKYVKEANNNCKWIRIGNSMNATVVSHEKVYTPTIDDVGHELRFSYTPVRKDGVSGQTVQHTFSAVTANGPTISKGKLEQNGEGFLEVSYKYTGGVEGKSLVMWQIKNDDGVVVVFAKTNEKVISPHPDLYHREVIADVVPVREDGTKGQKVRVGSIVVKPRPSIIDAEIRAKNGDIRPGNTLRVFTVSECQGKFFFRWYRATEKTATDWELIEGAESQEFTPRDIDAGYFIRATSYVRNSDGWESDIIECITPKKVGVAPLRVAIEPSDKVTTGMELKATVTNAGNVVENAKISWERSDADGFVQVSDGETYIVTANDYNHTIRCVSSDVTSDETSQVVLPGNMKSMVNAVARTKNFRFKCTSKSSNSTWNVQITDTGLSMKSKIGNEKTGKWSSITSEAIDGTKDEIRLTLDVSTSFVLVPEIEEQRIISAIGAENARDFVVCVINSLSRA